MAKNDFLQRTQYLVSALKHGSLGKGAEASGISAPQMSREVALLEKELGVPLLVRYPTGVRATAEGAYFAERMEPLIAKLASIEHSVIQSTQVSAVIALPMTSGTELFAEWIANFQSVNPSAHIRTSLIETDDDMSRTPCDFRVVIARQPKDENQIAIHLAAMPLVNVASSDYLLSAGDVLEPESLAWHRLWYSPGETELPVILKHVKDPGRFFRVDLSGAHSSGSLLALRNTIRAGDGIGIAVPRYLVHREIESGRLVEILPEWRSEPQDMWFLRPPSRFPSLLGQQLVQWFREKAAEHPALIRNQ